MLQITEVHIIFFTITHMGIFNGKCKLCHHIEHKRYLGKVNVHEDISNKLKIRVYR